MNNLVMKKTMSLPTIAARGLVVFPNTLMHFDMIREKSIAALENALGSSDFCDSPSRFTKPPKGIKRKAYLVSLPCFFQIVGPNPIANSLTLTLHFFATRKCPPSCINIKNPSKNIIFNALIKKLINISTLCFKNFYIKRNKKYVNGAINIRLSILSNIPPCPGIKLLKSLIPTYLFIEEAARSPI